ncbi:MAG: YceI family protein [Vicinamibacterales bacterium]
MRTALATLLVLTGVLLAALPAPAGAQATVWQVDAGDVRVRCPLTVGGAFEATSRTLAGTLRASATAPAALEGTLTVDLTSLDTGIALRNTHMRDTYLEVARGPGFDAARLQSITLGSDTATSATGRVPFTARLTLHGMEHPITGQAEIRRSGDTVRVDARFPVSLPSFGIASPRYLGVGVRDEVEVRVIFDAIARVEPPRP